MKKFKQLREDLNEVRIKDTVQYIQKAHAGQERAPGVDYWHHPADVARKVRKLFGSKATKDAIHAALLHDTIEDTDTSPEDLKRMGYSDKVIQAVQLLTKNKKLTYGGNIGNIAKSDNDIAKMVKYADNLDNFSATPKVGASPEKVMKSKTKYARSMNILGQVISRRIGKPVKADYKYNPA